MITQLFGLIHEQRSIRLHALAITSAEQTSHRLPRCFAKQIPQCDVDAADRVCDGTTATEPEHVLMELLAHTFGFESVFASIQRLQHGQRSTHKRIVGEHTAEPDSSFIRVDGDERVDAVFGTEFVAPATFRCGSAQTCAAYFSDFHGCRWKSLAWGWKGTSASSGNMGRTHLVWPRLRRLALVEPGASTSM